MMIFPVRGAISVTSNDGINSTVHVIRTRLRKSSLKSQIINNII